MMGKRYLAGMAVVLAVAVALVLAACGDSGDASYDDGYTDGYRDGTYNSCFEPESVDAFLADIEKNVSGREGSDPKYAVGYRDGYEKAISDVITYATIGRDSGTPNPCQSTEEGAP